MQDAQGQGKRDAITNHYSLLPALSALREAAGVAFATALFIDDGSDAALGAEVADPQRCVGQVGGGRFLRGELAKVVNEVLLHSRGGGSGLADADGAVVEVFLEHLGNAIRQRAHTVGAKAERAAAADAG